jgi:hypothetical protein
MKNYDYMAESRNFMIGVAILVTLLILFGHQ